MSYTALYRKWRPQIFDDVVEQEHIVETLKNSVKNTRISHAYLFCGTRGTGKTTLAKVMSRAVNCLNNENGNPCNKCEICKGILSGSILDVVEIDAASNNSVDNVRNIRDEVVYMPSQCKYKVYIIDEVHMLSTGAFNALLKTLEEPPEHVIFILATTEPHKLPATILSRCQRFDFRRISQESIFNRLVEISNTMDIEIQDEAVKIISVLADGALRDAISILDQCISSKENNISYEDVLKVVGIADDKFIADLVDAIIEKKVYIIPEMIEELSNTGKDIPHFASDITSYFRNVLICKTTNNPEKIIKNYSYDINRIKTQSEKIDKDDIIGIITELSSMEASLKWTSNQRIMLEVFLIKLCYIKHNKISKDIENRILAIEEKIENIGDKPSVPQEKIVAIKEEKPEGKKEIVVEEELKEPVKKSEETSSLPSEKKDSSNEDFANWEEIIKELKNKRKMIIASNLSNTKAVKINEKQIGIIFNNKNSFNKEIINRAENLGIIASVYKDIMGEEISFKCIDNTSLAGEEDKREPENDENSKKIDELSKRFGSNFNIIE